MAYVSKLGHFTIKSEGENRKNPNSRKTGDLPKLGLIPKVSPYTDVFWGISQMLGKSPVYELLGLYQNWVILLVKLLVFWKQGLQTIGTKTAINLNRTAKIQKYFGAFLDTYVGTFRHI